MAGAGGHRGGVFRENSRLDCAFPFFVAFFPTAEPAPGSRAAAAWSILCPGRLLDQLAGCPGVLSWCVTLAGCPGVLSWCVTLLCYPGDSWRLLAAHGCLCPGWISWGSPGGSWSPVAVSWLLARSIPPAWPVAPVAGGRGLDQLAAAPLPGVDQLAGCAGYPGQLAAGSAGRLSWSPVKIRPAWIC